MDKKKFRSLLSAQARREIKKRIVDARHIDTAYSLGADFFDDTQVGLFERFVEHPGFEKFMETRTASSISRFEHTLSTLLRRIALGIAPETIAAIAGEMSGKAYRAVERSFFMVPVDRESFEAFERHFIAIGEQRQDLTAPFVEFCASTEFSTLRQQFAPERPLFNEMFARLASLLLAVKDPDSVKAAAALLTAPHSVRLIHLSYDIGRWEEFVLNLFNIIARGPDAARFFRLLKLFSMRYPAVKHQSLEKKEKEHTRLYRRLAGIWNCLIIMPPDRVDDYRAFLKDYGSPRDEFENFVWELVFSLEPEKSLKAISIFVSTAFSSLRGYYGFTTEVVRFLIRNIVSVISEMDIRDISISLYRIVLKLLLGLKVDKNFLDRRAAFFMWMKEQTSSTLVELEVIRFLLFEYIFIALKLVDNGQRMKMTRFCDPNHAAFCHHIDELFGDMRYMRNRSKLEVFAPVLAMIRAGLWKPLFEKFSRQSLLLETIISVAESMDIEDAVLKALADTEPEHLERYCETLMDTFRQDPTRTREAAAPDYWHRVTLVDAMPYVKGVVMPLIGGVPILDGGLYAKTNGREIYLPSHINFFKDPLDPLTENRNLTAYIFCALHEAGHIIAGSFRFDMKFYASNLELPDLFFHIYNTFEDFRIESYMIRIGAHPQAGELTFFMNSYFSNSFMNMELGAAVRTLTHIVDEAVGYNKDIRETPQYMELIDSIMNAKLSTGRFRGMREMIDYGVQRLQNLDCANPLAVYPLVREFYEIMKHWHEADLAGILDPECSAKPLHDYDAASCPEGPLSREELDALYRAYNEDPLGFLHQYGLEAPGDLDPRGSEQRGAASNAQIDSFATGMLGVESPDYSLTGTMDYSHRTRADDEAAKVQTGEIKIKGKTGKPPEKKKSPEKTGEKKKNKGGKKKYVYSIDPRTRSRTRLSEINEYPVRDRNAEFFHKFRQWEYLAQKVYDRLSVLLPIVREEEDTSSFEGELNIETLIEVLSDRNRLHSAEFLDIYREKRRTLEVIIGLDASGSTGAFISGAPPTPHAAATEVLDVEKAFAIILGTALCHLTERVSSYAFNSLTSTNVYRAETIDAVSSFTALNGNRDGDFIRYINNIMEKSDAEVKYFFLLSDGMPASDNYMGKEALDDTLIAMRETVNSGVKLIYFNVDSERREYFDAFKKEATYAEHFSSPEQILPAIPELVAKIVDSIK